MPELTQEDWIEIYYALDTKAGKVEAGDYADEDPVDTWGPHLREIMEKIGPDGETAHDTTAELIEAARHLLLVFGTNKNLSEAAQRLQAALEKHRGIIYFIPSLRMVGKTYIK